MVGMELILVLGADIYMLTRLMNTGADSTSSESAGVGGSRSGGREEGDSEGEEVEGNLTVAVFSLVVNLILHVGCLFCARCVHVCGGWD